MVIQDNGNVGIGTTSPASALHINGDITLGDGAAATRIISAANGTSVPHQLYIRGSGVFNGNAQGGDIFIDGGYGKFDGGRGDVILGTADDAPAGTGKVSSYVGIGTTTPGAKLQVGDTDGTATNGIYIGSNMGMYTSDTNTLRIVGTIAGVGNLWVEGDVSGQSITDRTPYPKDLATAYEAVLSMERLSEGEYDENNKEHQLDHSKLDEFIKSGDGRDLSATVSAQNEVLKDLIKQIKELNTKVDEKDAEINELKQRISALENPK